MLYFKPAASCLLTLAIIVITQNANAQSCSTTASRNQETLPSNSQRDERETDPDSDPQIISPPFKQGRLFTRLGLLVAPYHSSASIATNGQLLSGGTAEASNNVSMTFDLGYEITKDISVTVTSGIPVKPQGFEIVFRQALNNEAGN